MKRTLIFILVAILALLCLASCSEYVADKLGTLEINIGTSISRGMQAMSMEVSSYNVVVTNSDGEEVMSSYRSTRTSYSVSVPAGTYTASVEALNSTGDVIGTGSGSAPVVAGQTNSFNIIVTEAAGNGTFRMAITAEAGHEFAYSINTADGTTVKSGNLVYYEGVYSVTETLANGFYTFSITSDSGKVVKYDAIRIIADKALSYSAEFLFLYDGTITIINEIIQNPAIAITLSSRFPKVGDTLTASATISGVASEYTCYWVLDGVPTSAASEYADLEYEIQDSDEGEHELSLFVVSGNIIWSESIVFNAREDKPTELEVEGPVDIWVVGNVLIPDDYDLKIRVNVGEFPDDMSAPYFHTRDYTSGSYTISCELDDVRDRGFYYYLEEVEGENGFTTIHVVIDRYIENPAFVNVSYDMDYIMIDDESISLRIGNGNDKGHVVYTNGQTTRTIKLDGGSYNSNGYSYCNGVPVYVRAEISPLPFTVSAGETVDVVFRQKPITTVNISVPDEYEDGQMFFFAEVGEYSGSNYALDGNTISMEAVSGDYEYVFYPMFEKDCYYTVSFTVPEDSVSPITAVASRQGEGFKATGITVPAGKIYYTYDSDTLFPEDLRIQWRVGDTYSGAQGLSWGYARNKTISDSGELEIFSTASSDYVIVPSLKESVDELGNPVTVIVLSINAAFEDYGTLNVTYDFSAPEITDFQKNSVMVIDGNGNEYYLPVCNTEPTVLKVKPGTYERNGAFTRINTDLGALAPYTDPRTFSVSSGGSTSISIKMETRD